MGGGGERHEAGGVVGSWSAVGKENQRQATGI